MGIKNTVESYGTIAKILHWGTAALFLAAYGSYYYRHWFTEEKTPENFSAIQVHFSIGVTIAVVVVLRVLWRMANRTPDLEPGTKLEHMAAHAGHYALYAIMIIMPITGYLGTGANTNLLRRSIMTVDGLERQLIPAGHYDHARLEGRRRFLRFLLRYIGFTLLAKIDRAEGLIR